MTARADLLALTDDALAALANRGIVKRAVREVAEGKGPAVSADGATVTAAFADGTTVVLAGGATLEQSTCTCPASGMCRHRVMLAVTYREAGPPGASGAGAADGSADAGAGVDARPDTGADRGSTGAWSPGAFTDEQLEAHSGSRALAAARRAHRAGYRARIRRPSASDPVPTVELATSTVRFLVAGELGYARVDAVRGTREDAMALAVWAFRVADERDPAAVEVDVEVGGLPGAGTAGGSGIEPLLPLLADLLADGVTGAGGALGPALAPARHALDRADLRWPVDLLDDLADQLDAYRDRAARYHPALAAALVAEALARHRCVTGGGATLRMQVLGTDESAETPLRLLRLVGLGARVRGDETSRTVECYLAHPDSAVVLAVRRRVEVAADDAEPDLGRIKTGGVRLAALSAGNVVTESAVRSANRLVRIAASRVARTTVSPSGGRWDALPGALVVRDLDAESARLAGLAPAVVRARVVAEAVRVVAVESVGEVRWAPGAQQLRARVAGVAGSATVVATHSGPAPGAIDALARALSGDAGPVRFVAGHLHRRHGGIEIEPTAVVAGDEVVVPAFAETGRRDAGAAPEPATDPLAAVLAEAVDVSADLLHHGTRRTPPSWLPRAERAARDLRRAGLTGAAAALTGVADAVRAGVADPLDRWADLHLRLLVTVEQL